MMSRLRRCLGVVGLAGVLGGCSSDGNGGSGSGPQHSEKFTPCDPLADQPLPISLGTLTGAGKDAAGVVFVVDKTEDYRVFVSENDQLVRRKIAGFGQEGDSDLTFSLMDREPMLTLKLELGPPLRMGVLYGPLATKTFSIGQEGEELTVVGIDAISEFPLVNFPGEVFVEYAAELPDQRWLVITRPLEDWSLEDFRVFFGLDPEIRERTVTDAVKAMSGPVTIAFDVDGVSASAHYGAVFPNPSTGEGSLTIGSQKWSLLQSTPPASGYACPEP